LASEHSTAATSRSFGDAAAQTVWEQQLRENRSFLFAHIVLFVAVLIGFIRTFYLSQFFGQPANDAPLAIHGAILTAWFSLTVVQAGLATRGQQHVHRAIAIPASLVALGVVATAIWINTRLALQIQSPRSPLNMFIWGNYLTLVSYTALLSAGIAFRRHAAIHRRLILLSSISIIGPAFARLAFWPLFGSLGVAGGPPFAVAGMLISILALAGYDRLTLGQIHRATWAGIGVIVLSLAAGLGLGISGLGFEALRQFRLLA
jgi:hypothetical protein